MTSFRCQAEGNTAINRYFVYNNIDEVIITKHNPSGGYSPEGLLSITDYSHLYFAIRRDLFVLFLCPNPVLPK